MAISVPRGGCQALSGRLRCAGGWITTLLQRQGLGYPGMTDRAHKLDLIAEEHPTNEQTLPHSVLREQKWNLLVGRPDCTEVYGLHLS